MRVGNPCAKCGSANVVRIPDSGRYASGSNIYTTSATLFGRIPVIRYVCAQCGYVESWVEAPKDLKKIRERFG